MKMRHSRGYTLLELLVVIAIIALLAAIAVPAGNAVLLRAKVARSKATIHNLQTAIAGYHTEYHRYPVETGAAADAEIVTDEADPLIMVLLGAGDQPMNRKGVAFFSESGSTGGRSGLRYDDESAALLDPWGRPFHVLLDTDSNNLVANPDRENESDAISGEASRNLPHGIAIYSHGPDGKPHTKDDIVSWR
jgi:prepilin-type N-terminal cleavage/methylation domain-containing protein